MQQVLNAITQVSLALVIPFTWWLFFNKRVDPFLEWLGFKAFKPTQQNITWIIGGIVVSLAPMLLLTSMVDLPHLATGAFTGKGVEAIPSILVFAWIATSLSEEIFFRGFLTKRLINKFDTQMGISIQATVFGVLHMAMIAPLVKDSFVVLIVGAVVAGGAAIMAYTNEVQAEGSVLPSWIMHASGNTIAGLIAAFNLLGATA